MLLYARRPANPDKSRRRRINSQLIVYNMILYIPPYARRRLVTVTFFARDTMISFYDHFFFYRRRLRSAGGEITAIILYT